MAEGETEWEIVRCSEVTHINSIHVSLTKASASCLRKTICMPVQTPGGGPKSLGNAQYSHH